MLIGTCADETGQPDDIRDREAALARAVASGAAGLRRLGCAALDLAYVAAGRLDGFWATHLNPWEFAAGVLLVREAGGYASDLSGAGEPAGDGGILVANDHLHAALGALLHAA
jgi:myo-inositol-1(or 4)-monophosphatase